MNKTIMQSLGFGQAVDAIEHGLCPMCGDRVHPDDFRDDLSRKEYTISGLCQACQDLVFGKEE
jgi:hypothetical protein